MRVEHAQVSLLGARETNQDRVSVVVSDQAALLIACDGMGGHAEGERAAVLAQALLTERFNQTTQPLFDPLGFLHLVLGAAHQKVVATGVGMPLETRPRATCAVCLVQQRSAYWAHVGDSRIYHLRQGRVLTRTRDHSHVEVLVREGVISPDQLQTHPMRNFVESCLGGEALVPEMSLSRRQPLQAGDILLVCTDGLWANLDDASIAAAFAAPDTILFEALKRLSERAVAHGGAGSDNTSSAVLRFLE
ncbi:MAG: PP2C family serine/threonine-protein phosphatase [Steroidobacteraceae bacterium]